MIKEFQKLLKEKQIDYYIVPTDDDHQSETVGDYYQSRAYLSGFDGSAGVLLVTQEEAFLWTDGRYFIQAQKQLYDGITLMKQGMKGVPTLNDFILARLKEDEVIAFDGKTMNCQFVLDIDERSNCSFVIRDIDLLEEYWTDRPAMSKEKAFLYESQYRGKETKDKLLDIRNYLKEAECDSHIITTLDDIAWIFNIRGHDIPHSPSLLAFALITLEDAYIYLQDGVYDNSIQEALLDQGVTIKNYYEIYEDAKKLEGCVLINPSQINYKIFQNLECDYITEENPSQKMKAIKNEVEIKNTTNAHLKDGVAMTRFMYWLKNNYPQTKMDELSIAQKVLEFRQQQDLFVEASFSTICGYKENAALMHYHATKDNFSQIDGDGLLLIDSGGQYLDGTTDITRTYALGQISDIEKEHYTRVLRGMITLQNAKFLYGCSGINLDILARTPMWDIDIDYQCGTGHGVGHFLNVHEGPHGIRPKPRLKGEETPLEVGMIVTDEPGVYLEGQYGIRIENELLVQPGTENEYGQFLHFDVLTLAPIDLDAINPKLLSTQEKVWLNNYHKLVYDKISPYLNNDEQVWLKQYTKAI